MYYKQAHMFTVEREIVCACKRKRDTERERERERESGGRDE